MCMKITKGIENCFGRIFSKWGELISRRGLLISMLTLLIFMPLSLGWLRRTEFPDQQKAWSPEGNQALSDEKLSQSLNLSNTELFQLIYKAKDDRNVLTKDDFIRVLTLHTRIQAADNRAFETKYCLKAGQRCAYSVHPAQFFQNEQGVITLPTGTEAQFLDIINSRRNPDPFINTQINLANMLGSPQIDNQQKYQTAKAIKFEYLIADKEQEFKNIIDDQLDKLQSDPTFNDYQVEVWSSQHFTEALDAGINNDIVIIQISIVLLVTYSLIVLGICHPVGLRLGAAGIGIGCTMLAFVSSYGFCCAIGLKVTSIHQLLPFLLLGIGADDMYVITAIADQINSKMIISKRMSRTMKLAGVSIFITSLTDFVAFLVSASSALPALRSFVVFAGFGILFDFIFEITIYSSFLACDLQRQKQGKHECFGAFFCKANSWFFCSGKCIPKSQLQEKEQQAQGAGQAKVHNSDEFNQQQLKSFEHNELEKQQQNAKKYGQNNTDRKLQTSNLKQESDVVQIPEKPAQKKTKTELVQDPNFQDDNLYIQNSFIQGCMKNCWSKFVTNTVAQVFILIFFAGLIAFSAWGTMQVTINFRLQFFVNSDHPLREYIRIKDQFFPNIGEPASYYTTQDSDLMTEDGQTKYLKTLNIYRNQDPCTFCDQKWIVDGSSLSWYVSYLDYVRGGSCSVCNNNCMNGDIVSTQNDFHKKCLYEYFERQGQIFVGRNILFTENQATRTVQSISASRTNFSMINPGTSEGAVNCMDQLRKVEQDFGPQGGFFYSQFFITWQQYKDFDRELSISLVLALTSIFVIILLISGNLLISLFILINMGLIDLNLVALIWYWDLNLNFITMINLVLAVGLAVDYSAHIAHGYSQSRADKNCKTNRERRLSKMVKGLSKIGTSVFHGAFSTFLAIVTISASKSYVFEAFFKQWFGIILFGLLHGFILLPVVLTFFGPLTAEDKNHDDEVKAENKPEIVVS